MAFEGAFFNVYDPRLGPRLLQSIMMGHVLDEKQIPRSPAQLSVAVESIRRHRLLSETTGGLSKIGDSRKGVVDVWVDHVMGLLCSTVAENRWEGLCLLGVTCQECSRQRFLEFYGAWFQKLLLALKQSTDPVFIRAAACASLTDLLIRLGNLIEYAGVRRDGAALISKLVQPILQILGDKDSSGMWSEAIDLLSAILRCFPTCLRQQFNNLGYIGRSFDLLHLALELGPIQFICDTQLEALFVARLMDADSPFLSRKCALCLALLPKAHGDAATWSSMIRRILIALHKELECAFTGMEDVASAEDALATLVPMGQDPPWPLGGPSAAANDSGRVSKCFWQQLVPRVGSLLQSCHYLLTKPYPVPVPVPIGPLLALAKRILRVDGSRLAIPTPLSATVSSVHQVHLCSEIPSLHLCALDLLLALLSGVRSQLLPHAGDVVRLVSDYFRRGAVAPVLRVKLYEFAGHLFVAMGAGMASALAPAVVGSALSDLKGSTLGTSVFSPQTSQTSRLNGSWSGQTTNHRKRKAPGSLPSEHQSNGAAEGTFNVIEGAVTVAVQIAALQALGAVLTSGGALLPDRWRAEVDAVLASVAMGVATGAIGAGLVVDEDTTYMEGGKPSLSATFQVAAYEALLASLLAPCSHRPPYLSQGLTIFRKGRQEAGTKVAEVSAHALLALEPLIHPRCLPSTGAISAGVVTSRAASTGNLGPHLQRPGKLMTAAGTISSGNFAGAVVPLALKVGELAMDPWAEVDTWLGYGEDFGDEDGLFDEDDNVSEDEFNGGPDGCVGARGGGDYSTKQQSANGHGSPAVDRNGRDGESLDETKLSPFLGDEFHPRNEESHEVELAEPPSLDNGVILGDSYRDQSTDLRSASDVPTIAGAVGGRDESSSPHKQEILNDSPLQTSSYSKEASLVTKPCSTDVGAVERNPGKSVKEVTDYLDGGRTTLASSFQSVVGPKTPAMGMYSISNAAVEARSESDSDGVLLDVIDGDPDSD